MLSKIEKPSDIKELSYFQLELLCSEIRQEIISTVAQQGGHLASNLGVVELTIAVHRIFNAPIDKLVFDVGHQSYVHKLLTGRYNLFSTLRSFGGLSGFPKRTESKYDCFETGHSSTAISAALGMARARDLKNENNHIVAIVGDGALTGGMCYEALNDCGNSKTRLIVILNDNEMSISKNVGAIAKYLTNIRGSVGYRKTKTAVKQGLGKIPFIGRGVHLVASTMKNTMKRFISETDDFFDALGFHYLGPVDGHDIKGMEKVLLQAKMYDEPVIIHCITQKGHGYQQAEDKPDTFHGIAPFYVETGDLRYPSKDIAYGEIAGKSLIKLASQNDGIVAITAAMAGGTGLECFRLAYPNKFFDVGIAEQHAVTMAAGMASNGLQPYFAVYSSFLQRGYDQVLHDVALQGLNVCFLIDRAGLAGEDGATHHGIFDIAFLRHIPGMTLLAPRNTKELEKMIDWTASTHVPCAIRYPRKSDGKAPFDYNAFEVGKWETLMSGKDGAILTFGSMISTAIETANKLAQNGIRMTVVNCSTIKPLDEKYLTELLESMPVFTIEEHALSCGFGSEIAEYAILNELLPPRFCYGIPDTFVQHGDRKRLVKYLGLTPEQIAAHIIMRIEKR